MKNMTLKTLFSATILGATLCSSANAHDKQTDSRGWFAGAAVGFSSVSIKPHDASENTAKTSKTAPTLRVFGGFQFFKYFSIEFDIEKSDSFSDRNTKDESHIQSTSFSPAFHLPLGDTQSFSFRAGPRYQAYEQGLGNDYYYKSSETWDELAPFWGVGYQANLKSGVRLTADFRRVNATLDEGLFWSESLSIDTNTLAFAVKYQF